MNKFEIKDLLPPNNVSDILGVSLGTLTVWRSTGRVDLPFVKVGQKVMCKPEDAQSFIERRTLAHTA